MDILLRYDFGYKFATIVWNEFPKNLSCLGQA